jgi:hypothetical protein
MRKAGASRAETKQRYDACGRATTAEEFWGTLRQYVTIREETT